MHGEKTKLDIKKHDGEDVSNSVSEKQKLWKEWKQENTSKEKHLEAKKKGGLCTRPNVKQKIKDLETLYNDMIRNVM